MRGSRGVGGGAETPWKITKLYGSLAILVCIAWKITKIPSQHSMFGHHKPAIETFCWRADDGPLLVVFGSTLPPKNPSELHWTPSDKPFWILTCCPSESLFVITRQDFVIPNRDLLDGIFYLPITLMIDYIIALNWV